jgi:coproporphyrinogen III oxidase-like Fe-S oxidoreductase
VDNLEKIKIYKKNSLYADFLFSYPSTYLFQKFIPSAEIDIHKLLSSSMSQNNILYIHIPFCYHICDFCNVYKEKVDFSLIEDYLSLLFLEIIEV